MIWPVTKEALSEPKNRIASASCSGRCDREILSARLAAPSRWTRWSRVGITTLAATARTQRFVAGLAGFGRIDPRGSRQPQREDLAFGDGGGVEMDITLGHATGSMPQQPGDRQFRKSKVARHTDKSVPKNG